MALRITYVGELGWELHVPTEFAVVVYEALMAAGRENCGIANAGYRAIGLTAGKRLSRLGRRHRSDHSPLEAGLGWAVKLDTDVPFLGRAVLEAQRRKPLVKRLVCFTVDDADVVLLSRETIYRDGERIGWLASAGYGYTVGKNIGYGYVRNPAGVDRDYLASGCYELEVAGERVACTLQLGALDDSLMKRIRM
ncbi:MAG: glycine cleavage T C-terminal barrel domain-containing protein [Gammaproteobacteria bacterium]